MNTSPPTRTFKLTVTNHDVDETVTTELKWAGDLDRFFLDAVQRAITGLILPRDNWEINIDVEPPTAAFWMTVKLTEVKA